MNKKIRSLNAALCFTIFGVGALGIGTIVLPLIFILAWQEERRKVLFCNFISLSWRLFVWIMEFFKLIKVNLSSNERQKLKKIEGKIVVANHPSLIDIVILVSLINKPICIVKGKLANNFFMKIIISYAYIKNNASSEDMIKQSAQALKKGFNLIIFPEGTRTLPNHEHPLQRGASYIAIETGNNILPIIIDPSEQILGKHQKWWDVGDKTVQYNLITKDEIITAKVIDKTKSANINARKITNIIKTLL